MKPRRCRFLIVATWPDGSCLEVESRRDVALTIPELVAKLREYADTIETADKVESEGSPS